MAATVTPQVPSSITSPLGMAPVEAPPAAPSRPAPASDHNASPSVSATVDRKELLARLRVIAKVAARRSPKAVLTNCVVRVDGDGLSLAATDLDTSVVLHVDAPTDTAACGLAIVPARPLMEAVRGADSATVTLASDGETLRVYSATSSVTLPQDRSGDYPLSVFDPAPGCDGAETQRELLLAAIARTIKATDNESSRYAFGGLCLERVADGSLGVIATDGRRLHKCEVSADFGADAGDCSWSTGDRWGGTVVVPSRACEALAATLKGEDTATVALSVQGAVITFSTRESWVASRLLEGRYPRWRDVVPNRANSDDTVAVVDVDTFRKAMRRAKATTSEDARGADLTIGLEDIRCQTASGDERIPATILHGSRQEVTLDPAFLLDIVQPLDKSAQVALSVIDHDSAVVATCGDLTAVLMPLARDRS